MRPAFYYKMWRLLQIATVQTTLFERIVFFNFPGNSVGYSGLFPSIQDYICFILHFVVKLYHLWRMQRFQNTNTDVYFDFVCLRTFLHLFSIAM